MVKFSEVMIRFKTFLNFLIFCTSTVRLIIIIITIIILVIMIVIIIMIMIIIIIKQEVRQVIR